MNHAFRVVGLLSSSSSSPLPKPQSKVDREHMSLILNINANEERGKDIEKQWDVNCATINELQENYNFCKRVNNEQATTIEIKEEKAQAKGNYRR